MFFDTFDIIEAYCVLEWHYNVGGVLWERPLCRHKRESIGVVLHRLRFNPRPSLEYATLSENAKAIYWACVKRWNLPVSETVNRIRFRHYVGSEAP